MHTSAMDTGSGESFPAFPFPPYDIQLGFMRALYKALDQGGVGLFESPTGTGKTLSLICGVLHWLHDAREREKAEAEAKAAEAAAGGGDEDDMPNWMREFASQEEEKLRKHAEAQRKAQIAKAKARLLPGGKRPTAERTSGAHIDDPEAEFLLDEWDGTEEASAGKGPGSRKRHALLSDSEDSDAEPDVTLGEAAPLEPPRKMQIIFCSRTHSQLTQFVGELHRTPFADAMSLVALGSRRALCINEDVLRLRSPGLINERCLELQKPASSKKKSTDADGKSVRSKATSARCAFLAAGSKAADTMRDMVLAHPMDIEELAVLGKRRSICPYYASRRAAPEADIVLAPYSALLVAETREALGLRVEGNVIIVDEAHNLVDAINGSHSAELPGSHAAVAEMQLAGYFDRFRTRLAPGNARNVQALARVAGALAGLAQGGGRLHYASTTTTPTAKAYTVNDFLFASGLDNVNVFQLVRYARETKAVFKIAGFWQSVRRNQGAEAQGASTSTASDGPEPEGATGALHALLSFLQALTNDDADGRVIVDPEGAVIKFVLLNAAAQFAKVASSAHAVILASGTLSPLEPVLQLFPSTPKESIHNYACGHVVSKSRLLALAVGAGPSGATLDFRHASRSAHATMDELGRLLVNVCSAAPGGVVVFFPSFAYIEQVHARWSSTGALGTLSAKKTVFREPRAAAEVDSMLEEYGACIADGGAGAVLLCVVGGKLAEGINFGDALGRCVVMVGLPYPNPSDPELQERLKYIDRTAAAGQGGSAPPPSQPSQQGGNSASREHYINLCMKAVNQCVGRAIRHRRDYAAVLLVDIRYAAGASGNPGQLTGPLAKLPGWIQQSLEVPRGFGDAYGKLVRFYKGMQAEDSVQQ